MIRKYAEIFCWKNVSSFCNAKATHIFSAKNIRILYIDCAKTVNEMTLNELVKLTTLWTTGPWTQWSEDQKIWSTVWWSTEKHFTGITWHLHQLLRRYMSQRTTNPTKWHVRPVKTQISLDIRPGWPVFTVCMTKAWVLSYPLSTQQRLWSDWADAQADLRLRWAHMPFCWFCHVLAHIINLTQRLTMWQRSHHPLISCLLLLLTHRFPTCP